MFLLYVALAHIYIYTHTYIFSFFAGQSKHLVVVFTHTADGGNLALVAKTSGELGTLKNKACCTSNMTSMLQQGVRRPGHDHGRCKKTLA